MNWISRLERKYGRFCIPNLISIIVGGQILVYAIELFVNQFISVYLGLSRSLLLMGQVWRLITFVFIPFSGGGPLSVILGIYFTWFIGTALEKEWGDFRFNLYFLLGMIGTVLGCLVTGIPADTYCLSLSLLLAFAMLYPEVQVLLFFVFPVTEMASRTMPVSTLPLLRSPALPTARQHSPRRRASAGAPPAG